MERRVLIAVVVLGAALRLSHLGTQSYWLDEVATVDLLERGFGSMLRGVAHGESTPPVYYVVAWVWAKVAGTDEAGLRALSAVVGIATIPLVAALGRRVGGPRGALFAAVAAATAPLLVWYGQEARAYALLVLLATASTLCALRAAERPSRGRLAAWGVLAALAVATHYFAAFVLAGQVLWLALRLPAERRRAAVATLVLPLAAAVAVAPMALDQRRAARAAFITAEPLGKRLLQVPKQFLSGYDAPGEVLVTLLLAGVAAAGLAGIARWARGRPWRELAATDAAGIALPVATGLGLPLVLVVAGNDFLLTRNLLGTLPLLAALCGGGLALLPRRALALAAAALGAAVGVACVLGVASDAQYQRDDWRGAAQALAGGSRPRLVVVDPGSGRVPALHYLAGSRVVTRGSYPVAEVDILAVSAAPPGGRRITPFISTAPPAGFVEIGRRSGPTWSVTRFVSRTPAPFTPLQISSIGPRPPDTVLLQTGR